MLNWLSDIFIEPSDKARFISVLITAVIAIFLLLLNQYFATRKTRKELLIKKIEEAYQASLAYEKNAWALMKDVQSGKRGVHGFFDPDYSLIGAMNEEVDKLAMLFGLYFPKVSFATEKYYAGPTIPVMEVFLKGKMMSEAEHLVISHATKDNIKANALELREICTGLMKKHRH